jgi:hypothetical protein
VDSAEIKGSRDADSIDISKEDDEEEIPSHYLKDFTRDDTEELCVRKEPNTKHGGNDCNASHHNGEQATPIIDDKAGGKAVILKDLGDGIFREGIFFGLFGEFYAEI